MAKRGLTVCVLARTFLMAKARHPYQIDAYFENGVLRDSQISSDRRHYRRLL